MAGWSAVIPPIVDASFLADHPHVVLADVRWYLDGRDGHAAFEAGHLPGAVWIDLDHDLAAHDAPATEGRHPFPTPTAFAATMSSHGIGDDSVVVAYDDTGGLTAGRLAVMLRMLGREAAVLNGGLLAWSGRVQTGPGATPQPAKFTPTPWPADRLASADDAALLGSRGGALLDARAYERFTGEVTIADPRPGHIPGASSAPWAAVLSDGKVRSAEELRDYYTTLGVSDERETIMYCGSGVSACMNVLAMERAGFQPPRLFVASWSGWSSDEAREAELGARPA
jgi:thiosulfate/3-mercaptopyruvate sulfurtransferase